MTKADHLTNERLRDMFENQFELVNYAIKLAEYFIISGKEPFVHHETENLSTQILEIIENGKDKFRNMPDEKSFMKEIEAVIINNNRKVPVVIEEEIEEETETTVEAI